MKYSVHVVIDAENDLWDIYRYVAQNDSVEKADRLLDNLAGTMKSLEDLPLRGHCPPELERIGILEFREIFFKPYRIIYRTIVSDVFVYCVLDGRRQLADILQERLLRSE
ncbi:MAG: type II toxin-antitoxin system RelE/ParE family toxin [Nitrospirae bacterium]|nr:type II toxin-antitoxin system RelE/ParE family toxin [Nitrospirota bacterium]